jgi:hypothetical protein
VPGYGEAIEKLMAGYDAFTPTQTQPAARFAAATPTSRQAFCDEIGRPYAYYTFLRR